MIVPLTGSQGTLGVLTAARRTGRPAFTADEVDMAAGFAAQASVAIELAEARSERAGPRCSTSVTGSPPTCTIT